MCLLCQALASRNIDLFFFFQIVVTVKSLALDGVCHNGLVKIRVGKKSAKTSRKKSDTLLEWNESFTFPIASDRCDVTFKLRDREKIWANSDSKSQVSIPWENFCEQAFEGKVGPYGLDIKICLTRQTEK